MVTAALGHYILNALHFTVAIRNVCVFLAPIFSAFSALSAYALTAEVHSTSAGLIAAAAIGIVPGYVSRSVAGSYDNEGVAIFALLFTYWLWVRALKRGSLLWACACALSYFYMVSAWGGYVFIINLIPLHVLVLLVCGYYTQRLYRVYCSFFVLATILAMQINFVGFQPVQSGEHMAAIGVFGLLQLKFLLDWIEHLFNNQVLFERFKRTALTLIVGSALAVFGIGTATGYISPFNGRFYSLLDPTYAKEHIPIIASVSEHQPTSWGSYFFDLHGLIILFPAGLYFCFKHVTEQNIFLILYGVTSIYFSGVMVRLMLVLAPIAAIFGGIALSSILDMYSAIAKRNERDYLEKKNKRTDTKQAGPSSGKRSSSGKRAALAASRARENKESDAAVLFRQQIPYITISVVTCAMIFFSYHCIWVSSEAYSSPSIVLAARGAQGEQIIFDDFRESYYWLRQNSAPDAKIMSWWDYGYQLAAMANRTVLVDNNTWNNSHIAVVGKAMASSEPVAYEIMQDLDVDYVLVLFGGLAGFQSDDINKFLWMIRIAGSTDPSIKEKDYFTSRGDYSIGSDASETMLNSLMYKLCYYRFAEMNTGDPSMPSGFDRVRYQEIGKKDIKLDYLEEAFTSQHWLVRIYRVPNRDNR
eukprot:CAMPEP_0201547152 /NCGR_PEP_ID=MMETSP0173_2-20130828/3571_1 /ASSEMBLY_ACC=CAM_ASM_000268 /TAXON_ID=218659 /ORGANISM="Vexillifera sp., Strain DIVA3 564/2" /LENGTH=642 /DNA_ID=CAMNT_0047956093 /DNA_START=239 /DNA_END=2167 /DNA_ORIENTATION=+